mmetsp:Transcript_12803/g.29247  ORF Transcript_12803/g.29247 Transcript_12803/m.29247 type:complete len:137 (+) Transcript_12803:59-469(+)
MVVRRRGVICKTAAVVFLSGMVGMQTPSLFQSRLAFVYAYSGHSAFRRSVSLPQRTGRGNMDLAVSAGKLFGQVATGDEHNCAIQADGKLACFGKSLYGQCAVPENLGPVLAVAAGAYHTCAIQTDGQLVCWGSDR